MYYLFYLQIHDVVKYLKSGFKQYIIILLIPMLFILLLPIEIYVTNSNTPLRQYGK